MIMVTVPGGLFEGRELFFNVFRHLLGSHTPYFHLIKTAIHQSIWAYFHSKKVLSIQKNRI